MFKKAYIITVIIVVVSAGSSHAEWWWSKKDKDEDVDYTKPYTVPRYPGITIYPEGTSPPPAQKGEASYDLGGVTKDDKWLRGTTWRGKQKWDITFGVNDEGYPFEIKFDADKLGRISTLRGTYRGGNNPVCYINSARFDYNARKLYFADARGAHFEGIFDPSFSRVEGSWYQGGDKLGTFHMERYVHPHGVLVDTDEAWIGHEFPGQRRPPKLSQEEQDKIDFYKPWYNSSPRMIFKKLWLHDRPEEWPAPPKIYDHQKYISSPEFKAREAENKVKAKEKAKKEAEEKEMRQRRDSWKRQTWWWK